VVLCIGAEHLTAVDVPTVTGGLAEATDQQTDGAAGLTFPGFFALVAHAHFGRHGTTREQLAAVPLKNRRHGASNPLATSGNR
jgi:acetyl-CoA C-acetyltransferase